MFQKIILGIFLLPPLLLAQETTIIKRNIFLHRRKRYLMFSERSNFVISMTLGKPLMEAQPKGFVLALECDVPFALPSDTRLHKNLKRNHYIQRREILSSLESAFTRYGFDGNACVKRMICEAQRYVDLSRKSLVKDILKTIFIDGATDWFPQLDNPCDFKNSECSFSLMKYILGSLGKVE